MDDHNSVPRNPNIAQVFFRRNLLENWGRGIRLMINECEMVHLPKPSVMEESGSVKVIFYRNPSRYPPRRFDTEI